MKNLEANPDEKIDIQDSIEDIEHQQKVAEKQELRQFTREYSPWARKNLADELKRARIMRQLKEASPEETKEKTEELQKNFYQRFADQKTEFEETIDKRDIANIAKEKGVFFVHSMPIKGINRWGTSMNNETVNAGELSLDELFQKIKKESPDLSCSSVSMENRPSPNEKEKVGTMYPFGVVLNAGTVLSAYRYDAGTLTEKDKGHKKSKYDPETKDTSIQSDIENKVGNVLDRKYDRYLNPKTGFNDGYINRETGEIESIKPEGEEGHNGLMMGRDFDEFVISKPKIDGFYVDLDNSLIKDSEDFMLFDEINRIVHQYVGVPVYVKRKDKITIYVYGPGDNVEVISDQDSFKSLKSLDDVIE